MKKAISILFVFCCLNSLFSYLKAETITYDFSSPKFWVTKSNGITSPQVDANFEKIYYKETNDCFIGKDKVYFKEGYLMLNAGASLKIPYNADWTINRITLQSHKTSAVTAEVSIYNGSDGILRVSELLTWKTQGGTYVYDIYSTYRKSPLFIVAKNSAARITSITIDYTSTNGSFVPAPTFSPGTSTFSAESLDISIVAAEGCEVYYTTNGTIPSYTNAGNYVGTKGNTVTIYASDSKMTLQAIAVDSATGLCSSVSSATYTYIAVANDGSKKKPYTVAEVKAMLLDKDEQWVKGTIYGTMVNDDIKEVTTTNFKSSNIVIGDEVVHIPIQLPQGTIREEINLVDHSYLKGKEILIKGNLESYCNSRGVKSPTAYQIIYDIPINSYGYATLFLDMPVSVPTGCTAYYCVVDDSRAILHSVGNVIPAGVGVVISSTPNTTCTLTYTTLTNPDEELILDSNQLVGFIQDTIVPNDNYTYYALNAKDGDVGFYIPQTLTDEGFVAKANKAYLKALKKCQAAMFVIHKGADETAIIPMLHTADDIVYDLQGRAVAFPVPGMYIVGGKKVIIR